MKMSHAALIGLSGFVWLAIGCFLLPLGLKMMMTGAHEAAEGAYLPLLSHLAPYIGGAEQGALLLTVIGLLIGYIKGRKVLNKSVHRSVSRIKTFPDPTSITNIYSKGYYLLIASMIGIGISIKYFGLSYDIRGLVDIAIGAALINGAMLYFHEMTALKKAQ
jgi:hypothetical protein